jgi:hypothetical protein
VKARTLPSSRALIGASQGPVAGELEAHVDRLLRAAPASKSTTARRVVEDLAGLVDLLAQAVEVAGVALALLLADLGEERQVLGRGELAVGLVVDALLEHVAEALEDHVAERT